MPRDIRLITKDLKCPVCQSGVRLLQDGETKLFACTWCGFGFLVTQEEIDGIDEEF